MYFTVKSDAFLKHLSTRMLACFSWARTGPTAGSCKYRTFSSYRSDRNLSEVSALSEGSLLVSVLEFLNMAISLLHD